MGSIDSRLTRLENDPDADYIELKGGGRFWFDPRELYKSFFLFYMDALRADYLGKERSPTPPIFEAITEAVDREEALDKVIPNWRSWRTSHNVKSAFDLDVLAEEGRLVPFNWAKLIMETEGADLAMKGSHISVPPSAYKRG